MASIPADIEVQKTSKIYRDALLWIFPSSLRGYVSGVLL